MPEIAGHLKDILERFLAVVRCVDAATLAAGRLESLPLPSQVGRSRVAGIDVNRPRMVAVLQAVVALSSIPAGLSSREIAAKIRQLTGQSEAEYGPRQASYDLKKLRGKGLVERVEKSRRYAATEPGLRTMAAVGIVREQVLKPILAKACHPEPHPPASPRKSRPAGESLSGDPRRSPQTVPHTQNLGVETSTTNCRWAAHNTTLSVRPGFVPARS